MAQVSHKLLGWTAAGALALMAGVSTASAGSVTQPGETIGFAAGAPLPEGVYFVNTADWGHRTGVDTDVGVTIPVFAWSTPWMVWGARLQFLLATPAIQVNPRHGDTVFGVYNPWISGQLAWDLGNGFGFSYLLGFYLPVHTDVSFDTGSLNQRFALSYTKDGWNLTANVIWGVQFESVTSTINPDFVNVDLTFTKKFGKWEIGPVAFGSADINRPVFNYAKQNQIAVGGLIGYDFGPLTVQAYVTTDVHEDNYGGKDTRGWARVILPLGNPFAAPTPPAPLTRKF